VEISLNGESARRMVDVKVDKDRREKLPLYLDGEGVSGQVTIRLKDGKRLEHNGIKIQFIGDIGQQ
jgi:vacuolar protein sorting-associated protein 26